MILPRRIRQLVIAGLVLALPVLILRAHARAPEELNFIDRAVLRASAPVQHGLSWLFQSVAHVWSRYIYLVDLREENQRLRSRMHSCARTWDALVSRLRAPPVSSSTQPANRGPF